MSFAASRYIACMRIQWRYCKVCCANKHPVQCNILKYLRKTKESAIKQAFCFLAILWERLGNFVVMTLLTYANELVSCGKDFLSCGNDFLTWGKNLQTCGNNFKTCGNDFLACGNDFANLWERLCNFVGTTF